MYFYLSLEHSHSQGVEGDLENEDNGALYETLAWRSFCDLLVNMPTVTKSNIQIFTNRL